MPQLQIATDGARQRDAGNSGHYSGTDLALLARAWAPIWIFDPTRRRMHWANPPALALWRAASLADLRLRDFDDMSAATEARIQRALDSVRAGQQPVEDWTVYPDGQPLHVQTRISGFRLEDGGLALLYEAANLPDALPATLRGIEALSHTSLMIALYAADGALLMCNPAAERAFGPVGALPATRQRIDEHFVEAADREALHADGQPIRFQPGDSGS